MRKYIVPHLKMFFTLVVLLVPALCFGLFGKTVEMGLAIIVGGVAAVFLNMDKFVRFKFGNMEAELRAAVQQAYATIEHVKEVTAPLIALGIANLTYEGRLSGFGFFEKHRILAEMSKGTKAIGLEKNKEIESALQVFYRIHTWDLLDGIRFNFVQKSRPLAEELQGLITRPTTDFPTEEVIIEIINKHGLSITSEEKEMIEDYTYYKKHLTPRRNTDLLE